MGGRLCWLIMDGTQNGNRLSSRRPVNDGTWHHVVALRSGGQMLLYLDGALEASKGSARDIAYTHRCDFRVGHTDSANTVDSHESMYYFKGQIDDVRVYGRELSADEVTAIYKSSAAARSK